MSKAQWDNTGERYFETGIDKGVLYLLRYGRYSDGEAWSGLINVTEKPSGAEPSPLYADDIKYLNLISTEELGLTVEAYTYPDKFNCCLGNAEIAAGVFAGQQKRHHFGMAYRTLIGNDKDGTEHGYYLNVIFDCLAAPSEKAYGTVSETPEPVSHSFDISTTQQVIDGYKPTSKLTLKSADFKEAGLWNVFRCFEDMLFGTETTNPRLLRLSEVPSTFAYQMYLRDGLGEAILDSTGERIQTRVFD